MGYNSCVSCIWVWLYLSVTKRVSIEDTSGSGLKAGSIKDVPLSPGCIVLTWNEIIKMSLIVFDG